MIDRMLAFLADAPPGTLVLAKCLLVLAVCHAMHVALRMANPRWRVVMWRTGVIVAAALPMVAAMVPQYEVALAPPSATAPASVEARHEAPPVDTTSAAAAAQASPIAVAEEIRDLGSAPPAPANVRGAEWIRQHAPAIAGGIWALVALAMLARIARGSLVAWRVRRRALPASMEWRETVAEAAAAMGVRRAVDVRVSDDTASPVLCGVARPAILLPASMDQEASPLRRRIVVAHELAHLGGGDLAWFAVFQVLRALFWFVPLAWWMPRLHERACEEVADAVAAEVAGGREAYARTLAQVALEAAGASLVPASIPMAGRAEIVGRLERLKKTFGTRALGRTTVASACTAALAGTVAMGGLRVARAQDVPEPPQPPAPPAVPAAPAVLSEQEFATRFAEIVDKLQIAGEERHVLMTSLEAMLDKSRARANAADPMDSAKLRAALLESLKTALARKISGVAVEFDQAMTAELEEMGRNLDEMSRALSASIASAAAGAGAIIVDNDNGPEAYSEAGEWKVSEATGFRRGTYRHAAVGGPNTATWTASLPAGGSYEVAAICVSGENRSRAASYTISAASGPVRVLIDQSRNGMQWQSLGVHEFAAGAATVTLDAAGSPGDAMTVVIADAVKFQPAGAAIALVEERIPSAKFVEVPAAAMEMTAAKGAASAPGGVRFEYSRTFESKLASGAGNRSASEVLAAPTKSIDCADEPLDSLLKQIADTHGLNIVFNPSEAVEVRTGTNTTTSRTLSNCRTTIRLSGIPLGDALTAILETHGFAWTLDDRGFVRVAVAGAGEAPGWKVPQKASGAAAPKPPAKPEEPSAPSEAPRASEPVPQTSRAERERDSWGLLLCEITGKAAAEDKLEFYKSEGVACVAEKVPTDKGPWRVVAGPYATETAATEATKALATEGFMLADVQLMHPAGGDGWWVLVLDGKEKEFAREMARELEQGGFPCKAESSPSDEGPWRVVSGPYSTEPEAAAEAEALRSRGFLVAGNPLQLRLGGSAK